MLVEAVLLMVLVVVLVVSTAVLVDVVLPRRSAPRLVVLLVLDALASLFGSNSLADAAGGV